MRKKDIPIVVLLFALLWLWPWVAGKIMPTPPAPQKRPEGLPSADATQQVARVESPAAQTNVAPIPPEPAVAVTNAPAAETSQHASDRPDIFSLTNDYVAIRVSSWGGGLVGAVLNAYRKTIDRDSEPLTFDFSETPALVYEGVPGLSTNYDFSVTRSNGAMSIGRSIGNGVRFTRSISFADSYLLKIVDQFCATETEATLPEHAIRVAPMRDSGETSSAGYNYLSIDTLDSHGGESVRHWGSKAWYSSSTETLADLFLERPRSGMGCSCAQARMTRWLEPEVHRRFGAEIEWAAVKNKFFTQILVPRNSADVAGFTLHARRQFVAEGSLQGRTSGMKSRTFALKDQETRIGFDTDNQLVFGDASLPNAWCRIVRQIKGHDWKYVAHAEPGKPVSVGGQKLDSRRLCRGDVLRIGDAALTFGGNENPEQEATWSKDPVLESVSLSMHFQGKLLAPGETLTHEMNYYVGPKEYSILRALRKDEIMEFGSWSFFCKLLLPTLNFIHTIVPNYGLAIIILTILIRIVFWPVMQKSTDTMKKMQELQPELKEIREKYAKDQQKMLRKQQELYKKYKVSPLGGCLPMLIQIPIFIALFVVLQSAVELRHASFLWIRDLSEPEGLLKGVLPCWPHQINLLPILMTITTVWQQKLTPTTGDANQQRMMLILMPLMFLALLYNMASALGIYWTTSQSLAILQLYWKKRKTSAKPKQQPQAR